MSTLSSSHPIISWNHSLNLSAEGRVLPMYASCKKLKDFLGDANPPELGNPCSCEERRFGVSNKCKASSCSAKYILLSLGFHFPFLPSLFIIKPSSFSIYSLPSASICTPSSSVLTISIALIDLLSKCSVRAKAGTCVFCLTPLW